MIQLSDEILNRYIDGELDQSTLNEVKTLLKNSEDDRKRLAALQLANRELNNLKVLQVSAGFTEKVMARVRKSSTVVKKDKYFLFSISSVFLFICLAVIGYVIALAIGSGSQSSNNIAIDSYINYLSTALSFVKDFLNTKNISIIGSIFSFGIIISGYIFFENLRNAKRRLSRLH